MRESEDVPPTPIEDAGATDEAAIRAVVARLGRPDRSGGLVVERAAIVAAGADSAAIVAWILAHGGEAEAAVAVESRGGLHRRESGPGTALPRRYVLPAGSLD